MTNNGVFVQGMQVNFSYT